MPQMYRLFVAIRPPEEIRDLLIDVMDEGPGLRWVGEDNLHLTLRFIGEVERPLASDLAAALDRIRFPGFELRIAGVGRFDQKGGGALWAGIEPRRLVADLAAKVDRACQTARLEPERRAFFPHITLARYGRDGRDKAREFEQRHADLASEPFAVEGFTLLESRLSRHGAHYEAVAEYPLD